MKMPMAAPIPPTLAPKSNAKVAGMMTTGQNLTPPTLGATIGKTKYTTRPTTAYKAALMAVNVMSRVFNFFTFLFD
jgi:hypothetical protein